MSKTPAFQLGAWQVHPDLNELRRADTRVRLQPRQMRLLLCLCDAPRSVFTRDELLAAVWDRRFVNDEVLSRTVAALRQALADDARRPCYIETIPKRGYRLLVSPGRAPGPPARYWQLPAAAACVLALAAAAWWWPRGAAPAPLDAASHRVITARPGAERAPALSPDGRRVAYLADEDADGQAEVWLLDTNTAARRRLATGAGGAMATSWAPGGDRLAVTLERDGACELGVAAADGAADWRPVAACAAGLGSGIDWSPDGRWLLFAAGDASGAGLARVPASGGPVETLTVPDRAATLDARPRYSPDGSRIAFTRGDNTVREIWLLEPGMTHGPRRLTEDGQFVVDLAWVDDGRLLFSSDREGREAVRLLDADTGTVSYVGAEEARMLDWRAGRLVWEQPVYEANIWRIADGGARPVIVSNRYDNHPALSPDGQRLAFLSNRSGRSAVWLARPDGSDQRLLLERPGARLTRPAWHPDGRRLVAAVFEGGTSYLAEIGLDGSLRRLPGTDGAQSGEWLGDGDDLLMIAQQSGRQWLYRVSGGEPRRVGAAAPSQARVAADGAIYFTRAGEPGLYRMAGIDDTPRPVLPELPAASWNDWHVSGNRLAWSDERGIWVAPLDAPEAACLVHSRPANVVGLSLALGADGNTVYASYTDGVEIDLVMARYQP